MRPTRILVGALLAVLLATAGCADASLEPEADSNRIDGALSPQSPATPRTPKAERKPTPEPSPSATREGVDEEEVRDLIDKISMPPPRTGLVTGGDVSWPQCPKGMGIPEKPALGLPMPLDSAEFVVFGLTNGPAFTPNPCLADQVEWARQRRLLVAAYAVNSYPDDETLARYGSQGPYDADTRLGALSNVGYQQARYNLRTMKAAGLQTPIIWLDVEPVPIFEWSPDTEANAAVVEGAARGYTDAGYRIGAYSTQALWATVVGDLELGIPEWRAAGQTSREEALRRCGPDRMFQGGDAVIAQWVEDNRDRNITCPGTAADLLRWFHQT